MKYIFTSLHWKLTLFCLVVTTILLLFCQLLGIIGLGGSFGLLSQYPLLAAILFYLFRAFLIGGLISVPLYFYARHFSRRIRHLATVLTSPSNEDDSTAIQDNTNDEIGRLAHYLNSRVQQFQRTIELQQELASSNERNRLARELHDTIKQQIFALSVQLTAATKLSRSGSDQHILYLQEAQKILRDIQAEMTNLIFPMRQAVPDDQDLAEALSIYLARWSQQYGILIRFTTEIQGQEKNYFFSAPIKGTFFRVAQEALSNVARHSKATRVHVTLTVGWLYITLKIADNGQGFNYVKQKGQGIGLSSMEERMNAINGNLQVNSKLLTGTVVIATYSPKDTEPNVAMLTTLKEINGAKLMAHLPWRSSLTGKLPVRIALTKPDRSNDLGGAMPH